MRPILIGKLTLCLMFLRTVLGQGAHLEQSAAEALKAGNLARVKDTCDRWAKAERQNEEPHILLGKAYHKAGFLDKAVESFVIAAELNPTNPRCFCGLGNTYLAARKFEQAEAEFGRALRLEQDCLQALTGRARVLLGQRRLQEALAAAQEAANAHPRSAGAHTVVGDVYRALGRDPFLTGEVLHARGLVSERTLQEAQNKRKVTGAPLEQILIDLGYMQSAELERLRAEQRDLALRRAENQYRTALSLRPGDADAQFGLGAVLETTARGEEAERSWRSFLEAEGETDRAWLVRRRLVMLDKTRVTEQPFASYPSWSPDGRWLAFGAYTRAEPVLRAVYVTQVASSSAPRKLCDSTSLIANMCAAWSPDGATIVFMRREWKDAQACRRREWHHCKHSFWAGSPVGTPSPRPITPSGNYLYPCWSADGKRLLFLAWPTVGSFSLEGDERQEFSIPRPNGVAWCHRLKVAPTGKVVGFHAVYGDGSTGIFVLRLTDDRTPIDTPVEIISRGKYINCSFAPAGDIVLFGGMVAEKEGALWAAPIDGSRRPVLVTAFSTPGQWPMGVLSPDGRRLAFDRHQSALWVSRLGGLDLAPVRMSVRRLPEGLELGVTSRSERTNRWSVSYRLFDEHSIQICEGTLDENPVPLKSGEAIRRTVELTPDQVRQLRVVKMIGESPAGQRVVALVGDDEELP